jgi:D-alanyl-D-alanine dipeptidase
MQNNYFQSAEFLEKEKIFLKKHDLVKISQDEKILIDYVPYATNDNFCHQQLYSHPFIYAHQDAFKNLRKASELAHQKGLKLRIWDAYRPFEVQAFMADKFPKHVENGYVSHPSEGVATHVRGIAIDLTLVDKNGKELDMGTGFDDMSEQSHHGSKAVSEKNKIAEGNRKILAEIMEKSGFEIYENEWWHYNLKIFKYDEKGEIIGAESIADKKYPKIPEGEFLDLLTPEIKKFFQKN